jgi:predicted HD superfamily hydrolase involved in NAD metabolism
MNDERVFSYLKSLLKKIVSKERLQHVLGTSELANSLSIIYGTNNNYAKMASLGHDLFRDIEPYRLLLMFRGYGKKENKFEHKKPILLHGKVAAFYLKKRFDIHEDVLDAIYWHVTGHRKLSRIGKILMIADIAEKNRPFPVSKEIRKKAFEDLDRAYEMTLSSKIEWALKDNTFLLPEIVETWNYIQGGA